MTFRITPLFHSLLLAACIGVSAGPLAAAPSMNDSGLDAAESATLTFMREEEKLARDVYRYLYPLWNQAVFDNIATSEQQHFEAVGDLISRYRLIDPAGQDMAGVFQNRDLQVMYDTLVQRGSESPLAALQVGALIEETDLVDLATAIVETDQSDLSRVYENLLQGSRNHLRAYVGAIEAMGLPYEAQVLSQAQLDAIVDSPMERGNRAAADRSGRFR